MHTDRGGRAWKCSPLPPTRVEDSPVGNTVMAVMAQTLSPNRLTQVTRKKLLKKLTFWVIWGKKWGISRVKNPYSSCALSQKADFHMQKIALAEHKRSEFACEKILWLSDKGKLRERRERFLHKCSVVSWVCHFKAEIIYKMSTFFFFLSLTQKRWHKKDAHFLLT